MLMQLPTLVVIIVYLLAALLPALFLMRYIYRKDTIEKEPRGMLIGLVFLGVAADFTLDRATLEVTRTLPIGCRRPAGRIRTWPD